MPWSQKADPVRQRGRDGRRRTVEAGNDVDRDDHEDALDRAGEDAEEEDLASQLSVTLAAQH